jgi:hypothetical protein
MMTGISTAHCSRGSARTLAVTVPDASTRFSVRVRPNTNAPA